MVEAARTASPAVQKLLAGASYKDVAGLGDGELEVLYGIAYGEFEQGKFAEAERTFGVLSFFDHKDDRFWLGLGASRQRQKKLPEAVAAYSMAAGMGSSNPLLPLSAAECYLALGLRAEALDALEAAIEWADNAEQPDRIVTRVAALLESLEQDGATKN